MSVKQSHLLGLNGRYYRYTSIYNTPAVKRIADSKLLTKNRLRKAKVSTPRLYRVFRKDQDIEAFDFSRLPESFVVKPNRGLGGEGIIVVEQGGKYAGEWLTTLGRKVTIGDLKLHIEDIIEGRFSMNDLPDIAFVEERIRIHPAFENYAYQGTPDIRVIVFNKIPVMAMLRLPTEESGGRANLFQGAVGVGIDMATGVTTYGIHHGDEVGYIPGTHRKVSGIQIPEWDTVLETAIKSQEITGIGFLGADLVLQPSIKKKNKTFVKVLELNAQPGLKIQLCNKAGLKRRLERVEGLEVDSVEKGIRVAKELFGDVRLAHVGKKARKIGVFEDVALYDAQGEKHTVRAKVDTGAYRSSIDRELARKLGLLAPDNILYEKYYKSALGRHKRPVVAITFELGGRRVETSASVSDRKNLKRPVLVGRRDLQGYVITFR